VDTAAAISDNSRVKMILSPPALKAIAGLPRREAAALMRKLEAFAADPG
jgi:hypothetical protein